MRIQSLLKATSNRQGTVSLEYALLAAVVVSAVVLGSAGFAGNMNGAFDQMGAATNGPGFSAKTLD
jgi:Flp pilus assembly pilin Flp